MPDQSADHPTESNADWWQVPNDLTVVAGAPLDSKTDGGPTYTRKPGFNWGFEIARRLVEPAFRKRLQKAKWRGEDCTVPACPQERFSDILARMRHHDRGLIVIPDSHEPQGVLVIRWEKR